MNVLFAASEVYPFVKTGGLADVAGELPRALDSLGVDLRILLPAYSSVLHKISPPLKIASIHIDGFDVNILETVLPGSSIKVWLVENKVLFERNGGPYLDPEGNEWPDNALRFSIFCKTGYVIASGLTSISWPVDIVHCHDWQTGLIPALLKQTGASPSTLFTIHNLAYQGLFPHQTFIDLQLPPQYWSHEALEFHNQLSFIKGGLVFSDRINTVSPTYAEEIKTAAFGCGLEGLLQYRSQVLTGILNGIDPDEWDPRTDTHLPVNYNVRSLTNKSASKLAAQSQFGLPMDETKLLLGMVSRLTHQKGVDILIEALPELAKMPLQIIILGTGDKHYEVQLKAAADSYPRHIAIKIAYDEALAHLLIAGADIFLMPSRFEPCGLTQMYSLRYGTVPMVRNVGGLADTVIHANSVDIDSGKATGIVIETDGHAELLKGAETALNLYKNKPQWRKLQKNGMQLDHSWAQSAGKYLEIYKELKKQA